MIVKRIFSFPLPKMEPGDFPKTLQPSSHRTKIPSSILERVTMLRGFSGETRSTTIVNNLMTGKGHVKDYFEKSFTFMQLAEAKGDGSLRISKICDPYKPMSNNLL